MIDVKQLKPSSNIDALNAIRMIGSPDYQKRIPEATKANQSSTFQSIMEYQPHKNEFIEGLINRVGLDVFRYNSYTNPLAIFKKGMLPFGDTIEEIQVGLLQAKEYSPDREYLERDLFGIERPDIQTNFHRINRQNYYRVTVNDEMLRRAFLSDTGISTMAARLMEAPSTSDAVDEFALMCQLFPLYASEGGFWRVNVPDVAAGGAAEAKQLLRKVREYADTLTFLSSQYNAAHMPAFVRKEELVWITTPGVNAAVDVEALAAAFNMTKAEMNVRTVVIPKEQFGISDAVGILTTEEWFMVYDQLITNASQPNPAGLYYNSFLHHHQVISASRFIPAILFTTGPGDTLVISSTPVTGINPITIYDRAGNVIAPATGLTRGEYYAFSSSAITTPAGGNNTGVNWKVTGNNSPSTFITPEGVLHISIAETSTQLTVTATTNAIDPSNPRSQTFTTSVTPVLTGQIGSLWPTVTDITQITAKGVNVAPAFNPNVFTYTVAVGGAGTVTAADIAVAGPNSKDLIVKVASDGKSFTVQNLAGYQKPTYTVTVTV